MSLGHGYKHLYKFSLLCTPSSAKLANVITRNNVQNSRRILIHTPDTYEYSGYTVYVSQIRKSAYMVIQHKQSLGKSGRSFWRKEIRIGELVLY